MPNWCTNSTLIEGDKNEIADLMLAITVTDNNSQSVLLTNLLPMPAILEGTRSPNLSGEFDPDGKIAEWVADPENEYWDEAQYVKARADHEDGLRKAQEALEQTGHSNWYSWQGQNWGIKWGDCETYIVSRATDSIQISYETPWGPFGAGFWQKVSEMYPNLLFETVYEEPNMAFFGVLVAKGGNILFDKSADFPEPDENSDPSDHDVWQEVHEKMLDLRDEMLNEAHATL